MADRVGAEQCFDVAVEGRFWSDLEGLEVQQQALGSVAVQAHVYGLNVSSRTLIRPCTQTTRSSHDCHLCESSVPPTP
ncbi:hypothetical protein [Nonomuraea glycinis]|uniref:hypothetical protein n=1 Tax=Nonomuraea glycinis TaxID=2047744 RepID=UPI0033A6275B